jgi:hypothetical protein
LFENLKKKPKKLPLTAKKRKPLIESAFLLVILLRKSLVKIYLHWPLVTRTAGGTEER